MGAEEGLRVAQAMSVCSRREFGPKYNPAVLIWLAWVGEVRVGVLEGPGKGGRWGEGSKREGMRREGDPVGGQGQGCSLGNNRNLAHLSTCNPRGAAAE